MDAVDLVDLYNTYRQPMVRWARRYVKEYAEDLVQDVFVHLLENGRFRRYRDVPNIGGWLRTCVKFACHTYFHSRFGHPLRPGEFHCSVEQLVTDDRLGVANEFSRRMAYLDTGFDKVLAENCVFRLISKPIEREIFYEYLIGFSTPEIARLRGLSANVVEYAITRARLAIIDAHERSRGGPPPSVRRYRRIHAMRMERLHRTNYGRN